MCFSRLGGTYRFTATVVLPEICTHTRPLTFLTLGRAFTSAFALSRIVLAFVRVRGLTATSLRSFAVVTTRRKRVLSVARSLGRFRVLLLFFLLLKLLVGLLVLFAVSLCIRFVFFRRLFFLRSVFLLLFAFLGVLFVFVVASVVAGVCM